MRAIVSAFLAILLTLSCTTVSFADARTGGTTLYVEKTTENADIDWMSDDVPLRLPSEVLYFDTVLGIDGKEYFRIDCAETPCDEEVQALLRVVYGIDVSLGPSIMHQYSGVGFPPLSISDNGEIHYEGKLYVFIKEPRMTVRYKEDFAMPNDCAISNQLYFNDYGYTCVTVKVSTTDTYSLKEIRESIAAQDFVDACELCVCDYYGGIGKAFAGDVNRDGKVSSADVRDGLRMISGNYLGTYNVAADVCPTTSDFNGDDAFTTTDIRLLLDMLLQ